MPEIVEVEKLRRQLEPAWVGTSVEKISSCLGVVGDKFAPGGMLNLLVTLYGRKIKAVGRHGKWLRVEFENCSICQKEKI